jgi:hypothetical protein
MGALRQKDAETDVEKVQELMDAWKSGGLAVAGPEATLSAFQLGQVDELIITGSPDTLKPVQKLPEDAAPGDIQVITSNPGGAGDEGQLKLSGELITRAQQTVAWAHYSGSAYEQTEQSESRHVHAARAPEPGRRRAGVAQAERDRVSAHLATGEHQGETMAGAGRRRRSRHGEVCRQRDDGRDVATR